MAAEADRDGVTELVHAFLLERTSDFSGPQTAAFLAGWASMAELLERLDLLLPNASPEVRHAIQRLVARIRAAEAEALSDPVDGSRGDPRA